MSSIIRAKPIRLSYGSDGLIAYFYEVKDIEAEHKQWQAALDMEKKRADELELRLKHFPNSESFVSMYVFNITKRHAEKAEAKLKEAADGVERIAKDLSNPTIKRNLLFISVTKLAKKLRDAP